MQDLVPIPFLRAKPCAFIALSLMLIASNAFGAESVCFGGTAKGRLENGVALPQSGPNFTAYSRFASTLDRTYVHSKVADVVGEAYAALAKAQKDLVFVYGESGHEKGGPFPPHRTHQNGLSVDFMVPVRNKAGRSVALPTHPLNRYGYDLEFDRRGRMKDYRIDFEAMALHLEALDRSAKKRGIGIERVIFDPAYLPLLFATSRGVYLQSEMTFMRRQAWVRHDEHYHVDFALPCKPLR
ncbi:penicillin-insensitive murein endopeptidase [Microvirga sp. ACRRW]|uniref:penicillin-insensitive murein endopeptidase n=1 Tax=Microvirga sp. ACRRW TaxID=2918205 RepID=UPI001EF49854|nr:penicillin-insensitive murein endopeptidase [Microvirga sp. ACRRW]MCG7393273.1 penicillin-insensitive murein endopeptidase [Microvirga sp. ACRRW]